MLSRWWLEGILASALIGSAGAVILAYGLNVLRHGRLRDDRLIRQGGCLLLGQWPMEAGYWSLRPVSLWLARLRVRPDTLSWASLLSGLVAGVALATAHLGWAAGAATVSALLDALDGMVARATGVASDSGEVLDAAVDRYVEFAFLAGCGLYLRSSPALLTLALAALLGSFMVSYSTAKAEALGIELPPGGMRRPTRAVYLTAGTTLSALLAALNPGGAGARLPLALALTLVAAVANVSAARRLWLLARTMRDPASDTGGPPPRRTRPAGRVLPPGPDRRAA